MIDRLLTKEDLDRIDLKNAEGNFIDALYDTAKEQDAKTAHTILEIVTEDFVEPVANLYINDRDRKYAFELWRGIKKRL
jgi:hypothetical protein